MLSPMTQVVPSPVDVFQATSSLRHRTGNLHSPYSVDKFKALRSYCSKVTWWRMLWVCFSLPLPALAIALLSSFLPLQHPRHGPTFGYYIHASINNFSTSLGSVLHWTAATNLSNEVFSMQQILTVSSITMLLLVPQFIMLTKYWMFPIPFTALTCSSLWCFDLFVALVLVLGRRVWQNPAFRESYDLYGSSMIVQSTQVAIYPAVSLLYDRCDNIQRIIITVAFPLIKYGLKKLLLRLGAKLGDLQTEVAVSGVEICASLYQSMIMQSAPSTVAMSFIMGLDVLQGFFAIKIFADRHTEPSIPRSELFQTADRLLDRGQDTFNPPKSTHNDLQKQKRILESALHLADTAEAILLVEYYEVIIPIINGLFILVASQFPSAQYNSRLAPYYHSPDQLRSALSSLAMYSLLQGLSCVVMHFVMKYRYGISAIAHLAFVLERCRRSIVGMMLAWLPVILHFTLMHYGPDLTFRFNVEDKYW